VQNISVPYQLSTNIILEIFKASIKVVIGYINTTVESVRFFLKEINISIARTNYTDQILHIYTVTKDFYFK